MNALDLLGAITLSQKVECLIESGAKTLLDNWRQDALGKNDDEILRAKLVERGWKFSRREDRWRHPKGESVPAPRDLLALARLTARSVLQGVLRGGKKKAAESADPGAAPGAAPGAGATGA